MKTKTLFFGLCLISLSAFAQVEINTETPNADLHIHSSSTTETSFQITNTSAQSTFRVFENGDVIIGEVSNSLITAAVNI